MVELGVLGRHLGRMRREWRRTQHPQHAHPPGTGATGAAASSAAAPTGRGTYRDFSVFE